MFVHDCVAHDGQREPDTTIAIIDENGCAVRLPRAIDAPVFASLGQPNSAKHVYIHIYGFQFTSSNLVTFECQVTPCFNLCEMKVIFVLDWKTFVGFKHTFFVAMQREK